MHGETGRSCAGIPWTMRIVSPASKVATKQPSLRPVRSDGGHLRQPRQGPMPSARWDETTGIKESGDHMSEQITVTDPLKSDRALQVKGSALKDYAQFVEAKALRDIAAGFDPQKIAPHLFDFQRA